MRYQTVTFTAAAPDAASPCFRRRREYPPAFVGPATSSTAGHHLQTAQRTKA